MEQVLRQVRVEIDTNYNVGISFLNTSDPTDVEDVTLEIIEEADEHQVFFEFAQVSVDVTSASNDTKVGGEVFLKVFGMLVQ